MLTCTEIKGGCEIYADELVLHRQRDALLIPMDLVHKPGLYGADGKLIEVAAYRRGVPELCFPVEGRIATVSVKDAALAPSGMEYVFVGHLTHHYGHFLFAILSRLWWLSGPLSKNVRLVVLNGRHAERVLELEFARQILSLLGITREHFIVFDEPVRFREIIIPEPALEENIGGHPRFANMCKRIGRELLSGIAAPRNARSIYLTKTALTSAVHRYANEDVFCKELAVCGVEIISPEALSFREQLLLWRNRPVVSGMFGSITHTSIFMPRRSYIGVNPEIWINSNQVILDKLSNTNGYIIHPQEGAPREYNVHGAGSLLHLEDPVGDARALFGEITRMRDMDWRARAREQFSTGFRRMWGTSTNPSKNLR